MLRDASPVADVMWRYGYYSWCGGDALFRCHPVYDLLREAAYAQITLKLGRATV